MLLSVRAWGLARASAASIRGPSKGGQSWAAPPFAGFQSTSYATRAAAAGVPMRELQAHLGHASITTTAEYYTDVEESAANRLRAVFAEVA